MRNWILAAGVATLAISVPAAAKPEKGNQGGGQQAQQQQRGGGGAQKATRGGQQQARAQRQMRVERPQRQEVRQMRAERSQRQEMRQMRAERPQRQMRVERQQRQEMRQARVERQERQQLRVRGNDRLERMAKRGGDRGQQRVIVDRGRNDVRTADNVVRVRDLNRAQARFADTRVLGLINGCPPGLDKKNNGCLPPGQAKKQWVGSVIPATLQSSLLPLQLRDYWQDNDDYYYRYNDGYLYQVNRDNNLIASLLPLFGGGYTLGQTFPYQSSSYFMPSYYQPFYRDTADMYYRYNDGYVYGIDPYSGMVENIIPMYDYGYGVGQMLPASYSYYNLPYPYRSYYTDNDDYYYRYAPGAIYQVDRDTQLISAMVSLLTGAPNSLAVGQPLPLGYDAYNVPFAYRDQYFDSPDNWYRYNNGYIYQVDPTTRLITAVIDAIV